MGQKNSKDESVYQQVMEGNVEAIKALCKEGARLEWIDKEGKTPLIVASMDPRLYIVAKTLIELGANINAYRPGSHAGTPLHHAAKRGLDHTVKLLLAHGANPFARNDDCQTPLDVARTKGHTNVVHAIEAHICYFSGDIREILLVPGILESLVPQRLARKSSKKSWVVVVPCGPPNTKKPPKLELAVYPSAQDPQPRTIIPLWKCNIREPKFHESDPSLTILNESTRTRYKFLSAIEGDRHQLAQLYSACKGFPKVMPSPSLPETNTSNRLEFSSASNSQSTSVTNGWGDVDGNDAAHSNCSPSIVPTPPKGSCNGWAYESTPEQHNGWADPGPSRPTLPEAKASHRPESSSGSNSQSSSTTTVWGDMKGNATHSDWGPSSVPPPTKASCNGWADKPKPEQYNGWADPGPSEPSVNPTTVVPTSIPSAPSAPPLPADVLDDGPIHYPTIDMVPMDLPVTSGEAKGKSDESGCVICWEAPIEGACIPCGHMAGCISCLSEIKSKKGVCPVCRAKIDQVIRLYAV